MSEEIAKMSLAELKEEAKRRGLKNVSSLRKQELAELLAKTGNPDREAMTPGKEKKAQAVKERTVQRKSVKEEQAEKASRGRAGVEKPERRGEAEKSEKTPGRRAGTETPEKAPGRRAGTETPEKAPERRSGAEETENPISDKTRLTEEAPAVYARPEKIQMTQTALPPHGMTEKREPALADRRIGLGRGRKEAEKKEWKGGNNAEQKAPDYYGALPKDVASLDSGETKEGILEVMPEGFGFIRCDNYLPGENDVYVAPAQIRRFGLRTGDIICGNTKVRLQTEKFSALLYIKSVNGLSLSEIARRVRFETMTPIFPNERIHLERPGCSMAMRMMDLISPIGKGQRGMIVSQPKTGKTTLLKEVAKSITGNHKDMHLIILLIDERPEEVTDIKESIEGEQVEVIYSTFDELPENHKRVSEMVIERAKRLVEQKMDVVILLDSITRLARAYNLTVQASGRTLSGGLDPAALHMPKKFFGAARNMREGGSLTILATALVETGSRMDDVVFEEFKGTGNMELVLNRNLSERRVFPAIDLPRSSTRREDLLFTPQELEASMLMRRAMNGVRSEEATERIISMFAQTKSNQEFIELIRKTKIIN